jgi:hypothetical protein
VTLEAVLTFVGILIAVLAIARPVQRRSLFLFVPIWSLVAAILISMGLIICRDAPLGVSPPFGWPLPILLYGLTIGAFVIPVMAALWSGLCWYRGELTGSKIEHVEKVFQAALREREFDEVERIVRNNRARLELLPPSAASVLFSPAMVAALVDSRSFIHLELLANTKFLRSLENRFDVVDVVVRKLLWADASPLRSAVVSRYGGQEHLEYPKSERTLIEKAFQNPEWYSLTRADYPLTISALEALRKGEIVAEYNSNGWDYAAPQGISARSRCPIYLAVKTHVLAIEGALEKGVEKDFYVSDLWDVFRAVQGRSNFDESVWLSVESQREYPTPYAYLLYQISSDFEHLSAKALQRATSRDTPQRAEAPGRIAVDLARIWSCCIASIADSQDQVSPAFRKDLIRQYLLFVLALRYQPSEVYVGPVEHDIAGLDVWCDLFLKEMRNRIVSVGSIKRQMVREAFVSLDQGKWFVGQGYSWLEQQLFE